MTREVEWDDRQRDRLLGLGLYESGICRQCGYHESLTHDTANHFMPTEHVCPVCRGRAQYERVQQVADQKVEKTLADKPREPRPGDGRTTHMRLMSPAEVEAAQRRRETPRGHTP